MRPHYLQLFVLLTLSACGLREPSPPPETPLRADAVVKTEAEWREQLTDQQFEILREKGTERPFSDNYWDHKERGIYHCAGCDLPLFSSSTKFKSGTGWPSFFEPVAEGHVSQAMDASYRMLRTEILCQRCGGHLGHVFDDGPAPTGLRYCVNGAALQFKAGRP